MFKKKKLSNSKVHVETPAEIKARKIKIGVGRFSIELTFAQLLALILTAGVAITIATSGGAVRTKYFYAEKKPIAIPGVMTPAPDKLHRK